MKKFLCMTAAVVMALSVAGCSSNKTTTQETTDDNAETSTVTVFAAASMTETLNQIAEMFNFDSSGTLKTQIQEGADCDIFISAAQKQMNQLDATQDTEANPDGLDFIDHETRFNLVSNSVVLIATEGNPKGLASFEDVGTDKVKLIALGNSDVPVGQYSEEIFTNMGIWDQLNADGKITFGSNVKEVLAQVEEGAVDCGVVYSTDAATSEKVDVVATAPEGTHKPIVYPAAVIKNAPNAEKAKEFLAYLKTDVCADVFESVGFAIPEE